MAVMLPATYFGLANFMLGTAGLNHLGESANTSIDRF